MYVDPFEALAKLRELCAFDEHGIRDSIDPYTAQDIADAFNALDEFMTKNGLWPKP